MDVIKRRRNPFRFGWVSSFFVIILVLAMLSVDIPVKAGNYIMLSSLAASGYHYKYQGTVSLPRESVGDLSSLIDIGCNARIKDAFAYLDGENTTTGIDIVLDPEDEKMTLEKGRFPSGKELSSHAPVAVIGKGRMQYTRKRDGVFYYKVCGEEYRVTGVLGNKYSDYLDYSVMLYYDCLGQKTREELIDDPKSPVSIQLGSDTEDIQKIFQERLRDKGCSLSMDPPAEGYSPYNLGEEKTGLLMFAFSFIGMLSAFELIFQHRKKELTICRIFGYSRGKLLARMIIPVLQLTFLAFLIYMGCFAVIMLIFGRIIGSHELGLSVSSLFMMLAMIFLAEAVAIIRPAMEILKRPLKEINDRESL